MVDVIDGDLDTVDAVLYGEQNHVNEDIVSSMQKNFMNDMLPSSVAFFTSMFALQKQLSLNRAIDLAKAGTRKIKSLWNDNEIRELQSIGDFQHAPDCMKRFIMAEPTIRAMWLKQLCCGYNDISNYNKDQSGDDLFEYREVMDGVMQMQPEDSKYDYVITHYDYPEDHLEDRISIYKQFNIYHSWQNLRELIHKGEEDPTSEVNGYLPT